MARAATGGARVLNIAGSGPWFGGAQVSWLHDAAVFDHPEAYRPAFVRWYRLLFRRRAGRGDLLITPSHHAQERLAHHLGVPPSRLHVLPHGADHLDDVDADGAALARLELEPGCYWLCVASRNPNKNLTRLIRAHARAGGGLPLVLVGAGLPILPGLAGESKSYAERLFNFPAVGPLPEPDAARALQDPVQAEGVAFDLDALHEIFRLTQGYPYFLQEWGYQAWNHAAASPIGADVILEASELVSQRLDENFFRVRFDRLNPAPFALDIGTSENLVVNANGGDDSFSATGNLAALIKITVDGGTGGDSLLGSHGEMAFTVPLFDAFMRRAMPRFEP